ncbi:methyl-accepting chemotaxis protein [Pseudomonas sp. LPB0260]|nr:methyl-accepting chemotaxis protein [Pseudomonas sp. LPB0260]QLC72424.1 methyl-accepting chemotaxis protein [Pseudomonas sp. LPB0260]QLC75200.1 methyl-accepting chemotaxis protein [Pseudomonas sp. LPB0260]
MSPSRLSIQLKITLLAGLCLVLIVTLLVGASLYQSTSTAELVRSSSSDMLKNSAKLRLQARGELQAIRIQRYFMDAYQYGTGFSRQILFLRDQAKKRFLDAFDLREDLTRQVRSSLEANPDLLGLYLVFEPNALDGKDELFVDQPALGSNEQGRFSLYWSQPSPGTLESESMSEEMLGDTKVGPSGDPYNAWYTCPRDSRKACVLEPYYDEVGGRQVLMTSIAFPLELEGKVIGVMGVDISLDSLQQLSLQANQELYAGEGHISIFSPAALLAGHSRDAKLLSAAVDKAYGEHSGELRPLISNGQAAELQHGEMMRVLQPFKPIPEAKNWSVLLEVPEQVLLGPARQLENQLDSRRTADSSLSLLIGLVAVLAGLLLMWLTARGVTRPILGVAAMLKDIASGEGDLTRRLAYAKQDELGELAGWFNRFLDKLQPVIADVKRSVQDARSTADQSAAIASQTSAGMQQQFREVDHVATAFQEMSATAQDVAHNAAQAAEAARTADQASHEGLGVIGQTTSSIELLANEMNVAMQEVEGLASSSEQIGSVLEVIRSIAEQTNLLALNAAIEAARAGEAGRGFAVVADEVRNLAKRTQDSVEEIRQVIEGLQSGTREVVSTMHSSHRQAQGSVAQVEQAVAALQRISQAVSVITEMNLQIASAAEEQSSVAEEINRNVASIRDVTEAISGQADESAQVSQNLNRLANHQQSLMDQFRV